MIDAADEKPLIVYGRLQERVKNTVRDKMEADEALDNSISRARESNHPLTDHRASRQVEPMPSCAIFADTQWEPAAVYRHLDWLHRSLKPLGAVDLSTTEERGQLDLFMNECEGMCGV